ncbi:hypothetical protein OAX95_00910 [bacterium]|nr:hypothetical protein [bacterium]
MQQKQLHVSIITDSLIRRWCRHHLASRLGRSRVVIRRWCSGYGAPIMSGTIRTIGARVCRLWALGSADDSDILIASAQVIRRELSGAEARRSWLRRVSSAVQAATRQWRVADWKGRSA